MLVKSSCSDQVPASKMSAVRVHSSTELMKNQKAAKQLPPLSSFVTLQTSGGNAMFFCLSSENELNLVVESPGSKSKTGWTISNLSADLSSLHAGKVINVRHFTAAKSPQDGRISVAFVCTVDQWETYLYILYSKSDKDGSEWMVSADHRKWMANSFNNLPNLDIASLSFVYGSKGYMALFVKLSSYWAPPSYYYSMSDQFSEWHALPQVTKEWPVSEFLSVSPGYRLVQVPQSWDNTVTMGENLLCFYQLVLVHGNKSLFLTMLEGGDEAFNLGCPDDTTAVSALSTRAEFFVARHSGKIEYICYGWSGNIIPNTIIENPIISGVRTLYSHQSETKTFLWGLNDKSEVFYSACDRGDEADPNSWSYPIPLFVGVRRISSHVSTATNANVVFAHTYGGDVFQFTQDPVTTHWYQRKILLPSFDVGHVTEYDTYTSHVQLTDGASLPLGKKKVSVTSTSSCSVYIDDVYHILSPDTPTDIETDHTGTMTIVQETTGLGAVCYYLQVEGSSEKVSVNPMSKLVDTISTVKSGDDLGKVRVPNGEGVSTPLVPSSIPSSHKDAVAQSLQQFVKANSKMPADGSMRKSKSSAEQESVPLGGSSGESDVTWGLFFEDGGCSYYEGADAEKSLVSSYE